MIYDRFILYVSLFRSPTTSQSYYRIWNGYIYPSHCDQLSRLGLYNTPIASLQRGKTLSNECPEYHIKPLNGEAPALKILGMWSTPS